MFIKLTRVFKGGTTEPRKDVHVNMDNVLYAWSMIHSDTQLAFTRLDIGPDRYLDVLETPSLIAKMANDMKTYGRIL